MGMRQIEYDQKYKSLRWIGYFDLLGTKELIKTNSHLAIFKVYRKAIEEFNNCKGSLVDINPIWFSDTFILYSEDNSVSGFRDLDHISRWFYYYLIKEEIPVRGAISYGDFYCDKNNSLFFGKPLIEAYEYGEAQDWLGLILCPSAEQKLNPAGIFSNQSSTYVYTDVPFKKRLMINGGESPIKNLPACILGCWLPHDFQENICQKLCQMMKKQNNKQKRKYENTINFLKENPRYVNL